MKMLGRVSVEPGSSRIRPFWRGHLFLFDRPKPASRSSQSSYKLLAVFLFLEVMVRPIFRIAAPRLGMASRPWWLLLEMSLLTALTCWLVVRFARVRLSDLGLYSWRRWSQTERLYFPQILAISVAVFSFFSWPELKALASRHDVWQILLFVCVPHIIWGFYQELLYRGILQAELVRRWGAALGILVSNLIFTFGPLHAYHFAWMRTNPSHLWIFAAIFAIGMFFAILFERSGNLFMVGILHGVGDWFIDGLAMVSRMAR
jgi:membrane protease YdiL (CAAX protease family)